MKDYGWVTIIAKPLFWVLEKIHDVFGNCVHLWERDGSVQRRFQQICEEAPAPGLGEEVHLPQLADARVTAVEGGDAASTHHPAGLSDHHEIGRAGDRIGRAHAVHLRVMEGEARPIGPELGHDPADDGRHGGIVLGTDGAEGQHGFQGSFYSGQWCLG